MTFQPQMMQAPCTKDVHEIVCGGHLAVSVYDDTINGLTDYLRTDLLAGMEWLELNPGS